MAIISVGHEAVLALLDVLRAGGVAIAPCDTIYGLVGEAPRTRTRLLSIKGRGPEKPLLQLVADISWAKRITGANPPDRLARHWPGPLTLVLPLVGGSIPTATIALRVPGSDWLRGLIAALGMPIYSTSVNRTGSEALWKIGEIKVEFERDVDLIVDGGDLPGATASTIVDATSRPYRVLRQGSLKLAPEDLE